MILGVKRSTAWALFAVFFLLPAQIVLSSEKTSNDVKADGTAVTFKITSPTSRNPLPAEIIDRMRKELMVLMGVEPEKSAEPVKKTGH